MSYYDEIAERAVRRKRESTDLKKSLRAILSKLIDSEEYSIIKCPNCDENTCYLGEDDEVCSSCWYHSER